MAPDRLDVVFIIGGREWPLFLESTEALEAAIARALGESGSVGRPPKEWEARTLAGAVLDPLKSLQDNGITSGTKVILNPRAGIGG